jgi:outer membrane protein TolC
MYKKTIALCLGLVCLAAAGQPALAQDASGVLKLTLNDCVVRALQNNISLQVAVLGPESATLSLAQAKDIYLPTLSLSYSKRNSENAGYSFLDTGNSTITKTDNFQGSITQTTPWGGRLSLALSDGMTDSTQVGNTINPRYNTSLSLSFSQPLLKGFGAKMTNKDIVIARNSLASSRIQLEKTVEDTIYSVTQAYWTLVYSIENLKVQKTSLQLAKDLLAQNQRKVEIGQMAPIEVLSAQAQVANIEAQILSAESSIKAYEDNLRLLLALSAEEEQQVKTIEPIDKPDFTAHPVDLDESLATAMVKRADLQMNRISIKSQELNLAYAKNQLLPNLSLTAGFSSPGISGTQITYDGSPLNGIVLSTIENGRSVAYSDTFGIKYPNWNVGLTLDVSLSSFLTKANYGLARLNLKTALLNLKSAEKTAYNEVRAAVRLLQTTYKQVQAYQVARDLAEKNLAAEEEKLRVGMSTNYVVLQYQNALGSARTSELQAIISYNVAKTGLERAIGTLLENKSIKVTDIPIY